MLQKIRDHLTGWVAGVIFFFIAIAFALWGIDIGGANQGFVAKVNGEPVSLAEFRQAYNNRLAQIAQNFEAGVPDQFRDVVESQVLEGFVQSRVLQHQVSERGYRVGNDLIAAELKKIPAFQVDGQFSFDQYQAQLASAGLNVTNYEESMRSRLAEAQLQGGLLATTFTTQSEFLRSYRLKNETREIGYLVVSAEDFFDDVVLEEADIQEYYDGHPDEFVSDETVDIEYVQVRPNDYLDDVDITEDDVLARYESNKSIYETPEQRDSRHILVSNLDRSDDEAEQLAQDLLDRINGGEDFAELAKEFSDDPGSGAEGGNLGWAEAQTYVGGFKDALFSMSVDEVRGPVKTEFGFHVIQMLGVRGGEVEPFESVKAELEQEMRDEAAVNLVADLKNDLANVAYENDNLDAVAEQFELELQQTAGITRTGFVPGVAGNRDVVTAAFSDAVLFDGENSDVIELDDNSLVVVRVAAHQEPEQQPLAEVRARIEQILKREGAEELAFAEGQSLLSQLKQGAGWATVTEEIDHEFSEPARINRNEGDAPSELRTAAFKASKPSEGTTFFDGLALGNGDYGVFSVSGVQQGDPATVASEQRETETAVLGQSLGRTEWGAYLGDLRANANVVLNQEQLELNQ